ncbi:MAG: ATP-binding protein [Lachnospiraceae bacterium]|nr:ATP-binding protein [Lachnospiraceae bacterium]
MNPPGYLYALSYVFCSYLIYVFVKSSLFKIGRKWLTILFSFLIVFWMIVSDGVAKWLFWPCMMVTVLLIFSLLYLGFQFDKKVAVYYAAQVFVLGEGCASLEWQMMYYLDKMNEMSHAVLLVVGSLMYLIIYTIVYWVEKKVHRRDLELELTRKQIASVCVIAFVIFCLSNLSYVSIETPFSVNSPSQIFNIHSWVDIGGIAILIAYHVMISEVQARVEMENMQSIMEMQYNNYIISEQSMDIVNQKYHDLKHQIALLRMEFGTKEGLEYLKEMQNQIEVYETLNKTGNRILDAILTSKSIYCQNQHIKLNCIADGAALAFMDAVDISALFGNGLDNAIECVSKIEDPEKRLIYLTIVREKKFLRIRLENCCLEQVEFENGLPKTQKSNKRLHGFGVKSMASIVKKYNGSLTMSVTNNWFEVRILIPLDE